MGDVIWITSDDSDDSDEEDDEDDDGWTPISDDLSTDDVAAAEEPRLNGRRNVLILILIVGVMLADFGFWTFEIVHKSLDDRKWNRSWNFAFFPWVSVPHPAGFSHSHDTVDI